MIENTLMHDERLIGIVSCNSIDYIEAVFNALATGRIVVPLREVGDEQRISATGLTEIREPALTSGWFAPLFTPQPDAEIAQISFTSGTEGKPKGVVLKHSALNDVVDRLMEISAVDESIREYIGVPVYHSFGYGRCRLISRVGGRAFIPENGFDPREISAMLAEGSINSLSAVPSMLRILLENSELFKQGQQGLKWIEIGSQPMSAAEKADLRALFPNACIVQHYGLTEASRTSLLRIDAATTNELESVGKGYGSTQIKINERGIICIKGDHLASGLLIDGELHPLPGSSGWFETSDLGSLAEGYLYFEGRADNLINCGGQKISAELIEDALRAELSLTSGIAVCRIPDPVYGEAILLAKDASCSVANARLVENAQRILARNGVSASGALKFYECEQLPATETGKVQRKLLAAAYEQDLHQHAPPVPDAASPEDSAEIRLLAAYQRKAGSQRVTLGDSLAALRLDSITAVSLSMEVERILRHVPHNWRAMSISQLALTEQQQHTSADVDASVSETVKGSTNENPKDLGFWALIKEDFVTHESDWLSQGFWAVFNHRFGNWRMGQPKAIRIPLTVIYRFHRRLIQIFCGIKLDYTVKLGRRVKLEHFGGMILGAKAIGDDVTIRQNTTFGVKDLSNLQGKPKIEAGVNIGAGAVVVGDITVGRYSVLGPNVVVDRDVPPFSIVAAPESLISSMDAES